MKIKQYLLTFLIISLLFLQFSCKKEEEKKQVLEDLTILTVNDFHGAITDKASKVGNVILSQKQKNPDNTLVLSSGDMFQGSALSNFRNGKDMVDLMNLMEFDAMTIGNHEFDWELSTVLNYFDGNPENGEANFPLLGCNVLDKRTNTIPSNMKEYTIIEKMGLKIGVIGYIGYGIESSIATKMIENYEFLEPVSIIKALAAALRTKQDVDIIIVSAHDATSEVNRKLALLSDDEKIDAIVNGHTHAKSYGLISRTNSDVKVPYVQAGSSGEAVGKIDLTIDKETKEVTSASVTNINITNVTKENEIIKQKVEALVLETKDVFEKVIGTAGRSLNQSTAALWVTNTILDYFNDKDMNIDVAFTNIGGIREAAFPINNGEAITYNRIYTMVPFDNTIKLVTLSGKVLKALIENPGELRYSNKSVSIVGNTIYINGEKLIEDNTYRVACIDYIFDKTTYPFLKGDNIYASGILLRDLLIEVISNDTENDKLCFLEGEKNE